MDVLRRISARLRARRADVSREDLTAIGDHQRQHDRPRGTAHPNPNRWSDHGGWV